MDTPSPDSSFDPPPSHSPPPSPALFSPISEQQRHHLIDALRGFAIFGILLVNMGGFKAPMLAAAATGERWMEGSANAATLLVIEVLASGKFVSMFALLFGMGMVMQEQRASAAGRSFNRFFLRRMFVLLFLGVVHGVLLWAGDVLAIYAIFGFIGLLFLNCRAGTLFIWSLAVFGGALVMLMGLGSLAVFDDGSADGWWRGMGDWWVQSYQTGTFGEIVLARSAEWGMTVGLGFFSFTPYVFALFLFGMALGKINFLARLDPFQPKLRLFVALALPAGLAASLLYAGVFRGNISGGMGTLALGMGGYVAGMPLLALSYAVLFSFLVRSGLASFVVDRLAAVGRLALSNYILQSIVANVIFMSWGFGLYGKVDAPTGVAIVFGVFTGQILLSHLWLRHFVIGPFEWVWRAVSYGSAPQLRRRAT